MFSEFSVFQCLNFFSIFFIGEAGFKMLDLP